MRHRVPATALGLVIAIALVGPTLALSSPVRGGGGLASASSLTVQTNDGPLPTTTTVTPYVGGRTLTWTAFDQLGATGSTPDFATSLNGVSGGAMGIVVTGRDATVQQAASWVSTDGGVTWTEHLVPGASSLGHVVGHGGVLVSLGSAFWSSTDGASWTRAATGPHAISFAQLAAGPQGFVAFVRNGANTTTRVWLSRTGTSGSWSAAPAQAVLSGFCPTSIAATSSRIVAIGVDCAKHRTAKVLVSTNGRTWTSAPVPSGLRVTGQFVRAPSVSYVGGRFLVTGANATQTATWVWSSSDGRSWRHTSSMPRTTLGDFTVDTIVGIFRLGPGWIAIGHRDMPADDAVRVAWRSADLVHWTRFSPPTAACDATVHMVSQAAVVRDRLIAVGNPWSIGSQCGETWMAAVT